ncbi:MAG: chemotaxis protein CheW [Rhodospirillales bacterium]
MDDLLSEFLTETSESLAVIDVELVKFEQNPNDAEILGNIFRLVHTIKGTCGFLGLPRLESVAHAGENVLGKFRDGELEVTPQAVTLILRCIDTIRDLLGELESTGEEPAGEDTELIAQLNSMAEGNTTPDIPPAGGSVPAASAEDDSPSANEFGAPVAAELLAEVEAAESQGVRAATDDEMRAEMAAEAEDASEGGAKAASDDAPSANEFGAPVAAELLAEVEDAQSKGVKAATDAQMKADMKAESAKDMDQAPLPTASAKPPAKTASGSPATKEEGGAKEGGVAQSSIRVNVDVLEDLMTLVSELVLTRNALLQMVRGIDDSEFTVPLQRLSHITTDLQEGVMKTRMQPIGNAWAKLPRIVRDLSVDQGKKIELVMLGAETELDRQVLELIKDPLTHMVRNSADHGLEMPDERSDAGKPETGTITLNAYHEGGHIIIEIKDDGKGLSMERIRNKIIDNGLATDAELDGLSDTQIQQFIFRAGFSTAEKVTNISGRGVGMDVVRTNIEKIGGTIELKSVEGVGTTFTIKIPLTLAIVSALIVECAGERFAIPQISVLELVRASSQTEHKVETINNSPVLRLRNRLLPLVMLRDLLRLPKRDEDSSEAINEELFIVVAQVGAYNFGIVVDRVFDTEEIVVKPVAPILRDTNVYSGNTILGDGSVIMILDPNGIANANGEIQAEDTGAADRDTVGKSDQTTSLLVFRAGDKELKAVPLALIARLEEIESETIESGHGRHLVQYRDHLMPLIPFNTAYQFSDSGHIPVLVFTDQDRSMGLVVDEIVDIVEDKLEIEITSDVPGIIGTATIAGKATDIMDSGYFLTKAFPDWFGKRDGSNKHENKSVLLIDDSQFFRQLLSPLLSVAGWHVSTVDSAEAALKLRDRGQDFDVIISDIEMPGMDGFEFAATVRNDGRWKNVPLVALSGNAAESDMAKGRQAGFSDYVAKYDREMLVETLAQTVALAAKG